MNLLNCYPIIVKITVDCGRLTEFHERMLWFIWTESTDCFIVFVAGLY